MRIKTINRSEEGETKERSQDVRKVHRNLDPALHPFEKATEYTRALVAGEARRRRRTMHGIAPARQSGPALPGTRAATPRAPGPQRKRSACSPSPS